MIRKLYGILAGFAVAGATMFQANGCTANVNLPVNFTGGTVETETVSESVPVDLSGLGGWYYF
jgi:hypothetical protein